MSTLNILSLVLFFSKISALLSTAQCACFFFFVFLHLVRTMLQKYAFQLLWGTNGKGSHSRLCCQTTYVFVLS